MTTQTRHVLVATCGLVLAPISCTGRSDLDVEAPPITTAYKPVDDCTDPLWVPAGNAYYGGVRIGGTEKYQSWKDPVIEVEAFECEELVLNRFVHVNDFYLDTDEVSPACYERCVEAGQCAAAPPRSEDQLALTVPFESAEAFCAFRGGYVPSYAELARAGSADGLSVGPAAVMLEWAACLQIQPVDCDHLLVRAPTRLEGVVATHTWKPRSDPKDVGPFGHYDLFGSQLEWTRSRANFDGAAFSPHGVSCDADSVEDPVDLGDGDLTLYAPGLSMREGVVDPSGWYQGTIQPYYENVLEAAAVEGWIGFRCAYDAEEMQP